MTKLTQLKQLLSTNLLTAKEQISLKGKGMGNMNSKSDKRCPPPVDEGKKDVKYKFR